MNRDVAHVSRRELSVSRLSSALGVPVIEGEVAHRSGTVVQIRIDQFAQYKPLMVEGSLAIVDSAAEAVMIRLGATETWLMATAAGAAPNDAFMDEGDTDEPALLDSPGYVLDSDRANRVASRIAQASGFAVVAKKPQFRDDFARPFVHDWYDAEASDWHVGEIAARARNLWEFGVLPRDAKAMRAGGESFASIATALGVSKDRAKWAVELPDEHSMTEYL